MVTYLIKSTLCLTLFLAFYHLVLEREKMHRFNRFYLLSSVLISFLAPLYTIYIKVVQEPVAEFTQLTDNTVFTEEIIPIEEPVNYWNYLIYFSIGVSTILLIRFIKNLFSIYRKVSTSEKFAYKNSTIVLVADNILPHTFWNYIFINKQEYETQKIEQELFTHELTHVAQKHTFDVLIIELLKVVFWFNPIFYILKKSVQLNHEFLADTNVVSQHKNVSKYQHLLINTSTWSNEYALASNLHYLVTKKRIVMMTKQTSKAVIRLKKLAVLPLIIGAIFLFAERVEAQEITEVVEDSKNVQKTEHTLTSDIKNDEIIEVVEDKNPITTNNFMVSVERKGSAINLKCNNCYRWADLEIPLNKEYIITDFGFSNGKNLKNDKYAFKIKATKNNIIFTGLKNTAWKDLRFSLYEGNKQFLNQNGMISKKENKKHIGAPIKRKSSKQSISPDPVLKDIKQEIKDVNTLKLSIKKDTIEKPISVKLGKLSASKNEMKEYKTILAKGKKDRLFKHKDILKMQYLFSTMSTEQKNSVEDYTSVVPPPPPPRMVKKGEASSIPPPPPPAPKIKKGEKSNIPPPPKPDWVYTYKRLANKVKRTSDNREANLIYLKEIYNKKMTNEEKSKVLEPSKLLQTTSNAVKTKDGVEKGWFYANNQTLYYVKEKGETKYFNRWGNTVDKEGKLKADDSVVYYLNGKRISKKELDKLNPNDIKTINVKKRKR